MSITLDDSELIALTGYERPSKQLAELIRHGFYRARIGRFNKVVLERAHFEAVCASHEPAANAPPPKVRPPRLWGSTSADPDVREKIRARALARAASEDPAERLERLERQKIKRKALVLFHSNKRRAAKIARTPAWADPVKTRAIYELAGQLSASTGVPHHVDHRIPLHGRNVSGLHVHTNLQVITGDENIRKRNKFEAD